MFFSLFTSDREHKELSRLPSQYRRQPRRYNCQRCSRREPESNSRIVFFSVETQAEAKTATSADGREGKAAEVASGAEKSGGSATRRNATTKVRLTRFSY